MLSLSGLETRQNFWCHRPKNLVARTKMRWSEGASEHTQSNNLIKYALLDKSNVVYL